MTTGDIDLGALLKRLHMPTVRRLYPDYAVRMSPIVNAGVAPS